MGNNARLPPDKLKGVHDSMSRLALYLLGPPRIERDGTAVQIRRRKAVALLAYLAVAGSSHSREKLATLLWPESDQSRALASLRVAFIATISWPGSPSPAAPPTTSGSSFRPRACGAN
jgi:hypothetical protein